MNQQEAERAVLGIRDILVRIRIRGSELLANGPVSGSNSFLSDFKDAKKIFFFIFFLITYPPLGTLSSVVKKLIFC
jgi:hypothetical protein